MEESPASGKHLTGLTLAAIGVVFGDIGTSPIYALRESFHPDHGIPPTSENVLGVLSLIFWSLIIVISVKYLGAVMKADNRGEGGIIALTALVSPPNEEAVGRRRLLVLAGLFGAALLYGDSMITPAISVLSAVEGLEVTTHGLHLFVIPITVVILVALFAFQPRGTARIGAVFGPVMVIWFATLAVTGIGSILRYPSVLQALLPSEAVDFFIRNRALSFLVLGSVFLVVTGGEALYADMGHFGKRPIRLAWFLLVLPCLMLNYLGQGALVIHDPGALSAPFFLLAPSWAAYPLIIITTVATIIASQAVISGAFSLTRQAVQLGYLPRLRIQHTSEKHIGQIYMPMVNWLLLIACIGLVLGFRSSSRLAAAYGVAVTTDMVFTTILFTVVALRRWQWRPSLVALMALGFLTVDLAFWGGNLPKIPHGGWFPLAVAGTMFVVMTTWKTGRRLLAANISSRNVPVEAFLTSLSQQWPTRVPGTAIYMNSTFEETPPALLHNLKHNQSLHERVILLTIVIHEVPHIDDEERLEIFGLGADIYRMKVNYGFAEYPDLPTALTGQMIGGKEIRMMETSFYLSREQLIAGSGPGLARWRRHLFVFLSRNALGAFSFFRLPPNRVVELGIQLEL
ncbi:potassium transporter Kup [Gemmatimonadota bacterium]